jgi:hypothetical protein
MHVSTGLLADPGRQECFAERGVVDDRKKLVLCSDVVMTQLAGDLTSSSQGLTHCRAALPRGRVGDLAPEADASPGSRGPR